MSSYRESWNAGNQDTPHKAAISPEFREALPCLAEVLGGVEVPKGETGGVPPATINLWFEGGELRFCVMPRTGSRIAFGVIPDPVKGFESLEKELANGRIGWKTGRNRRTA